MGLKHTRSPGPDGFWLHIAWRIWSRKKIKNVFTDFETLLQVLRDYTEGMQIRQVEAVKKLGAVNTGILISSIQEAIQLSDVSDVIENFYLFGLVDFLINEPERVAGGGLARLGRFTPSEQHVEVVKILFKTVFEDRDKPLPDSWKKQVSELTAKDLRQVRQRIAERERKWIPPFFRRPEGIDAYFNSARKNGVYDWKCDALSLRDPIDKLTEVRAIYSNLYWTKSFQRLLSRNGIGDPFKSLLGQIPEKFGTSPSRLWLEKERVGVGDPPDPHEVTRISAIIAKHLPQRRRPFGGGGRAGFDSTPSGGF